MRVATLSILLTKYVFKVNDLEAVYVQADDNLNSIADRYRKNPKKLFCYNELKGRSLKVGQYVFLEKKNNFYKNQNPKKSTKVHILRKGQSMYDVAQLYGLKLRKLYYFNKAYRNVVPDAGAQIYLTRHKK